MWRMDITARVAYHSVSSRTIRKPSVVYSERTIPQTDGKAERVILTFLEMRHDKAPFKGSEHRQKELCRFVNFYNTVKPLKGLTGDTPVEVLQAYFFNLLCKNAETSYTARN